MLDISAQVCYNNEADYGERCYRTECAGVAQLVEQLICNQQVGGSSPSTSFYNMGEFPSGQRGQTVNLLFFNFGGSNPPSPTHKNR